MSNPITLVSRKDISEFYENDYFVLSKGKKKSIYEQLFKNTEKNSFHGFDFMAGKKWYSRRKDSDEFHSSEFQFIASKDHTMTYALPHYCSGKLPYKYLMQAILQEKKFCIWSVLDSHMPAFCKRFLQPGYTLTYVDLSGKSSKQQKIFNIERPKLWHLEGTSKVTKEPISCFVYTIIPIRDYFFHYVRMAVQVAKLNGGDRENILEVMYFPSCETHLAKWSNLAAITEQLNEKDHVVMGSVMNIFRYYAKDEYFKEPSAIPKRATAIMPFTPLFQHLLKDDNVRLPKDEAYFTTIADYHDESKQWCVNPYYSISDMVTIQTVNNKRVVFLGFRYSYWGNAAGIICQELYKVVKNVSYVAKCATLKSENHIHAIAIPTDTAVIKDIPYSDEMEEATPIQEDENIYSRNEGGYTKRVMESILPVTTSHHILDIIQKLKISNVTIGPHVSVPTIVGETFEQRRVIDTIFKGEGNSIDNEIAYMNEAAHRARDCRYVALHFTTDYVRSENDKSVITLDDLADEKRSKDPTIMAQEMFHKANTFNILKHYLLGNE